MEKKPKYRADGGPENSNGEKRRELYSKAIRKAKSAHKNRFFIEAISIWESIIADRLEARRQYLSPETKDKHVFGTLGKNVSRLRSEEATENKEMFACFEKINERADGRNVAVHELVKLDRDNLDNNWKKRYEALKKTSEAGFELSKEISALVKKHNKRIKTPS